MMTSEIVDGLRQAHAAVRNAQLRLSRARAVLSAQQDDVESELRGAFQELDRTLRGIYRRQPFTKSKH